MHIPKLLYNALDASIADTLLKEIRPITKYKQDNNPAYRVLLGNTGVRWKYIDKEVLAENWTPVSHNLLNTVNSLLSTNFNSATGYIYGPMGIIYPHSDYRYITNIVSDVFAIASFGGTRTLNFSNGDKYVLESGSILLVPKEYDLKTTHFLIPEPGSSTSVSLTFRTLS